MDTKTEYMVAKQKPKRLIGKDIQAIVRVFPRKHLIELSQRRTILACIVGGKSHLKDSIGNG